MTHRGKIPYLPIVVGFCVAAIAGYAAFSYWAVFIGQDATMTGDVIGTWKSFAVLAFGFWLGSSSGGKAKDEGPTGEQNDPFAVQGPKPGHKPVSVEDEPKGE